MIEKNQIINIIKEIKKKHKNISFLNGGCLIFATSLFELLKEYGAEIYSEAYYDFDGKDYPVDHFVVKYNDVFLDASGEFNSKDKNLIKYPNDKLWVGDIWFDDKLIEEIKKDFHKELKCII